LPTISQQQAYNGALERVIRLGLSPLVSELQQVLTGFDLRLEERRDANGGAAVRSILDERFNGAGGWSQRTSGGVDWTKCSTHNGARVCVGAEIQFSGRSDMLIVDVTHLRDSIVGGEIDVGIIVVPADTTAPFLTDRVARFADATSAVERARAEDLPLLVYGLAHDGPGSALAKRRTRQGRAEVSEGGESGRSP
jgi:hypothetical protein